MQEPTLIRLGHAELIVLPLLSGEDYLPAIHDGIIGPRGKPGMTSLPDSFVILLL